IRIENIRVYSERQYVEITTSINEDRTTFNIHVVVTRELGSNYLIMNINLRGKYIGSTEYKRVFELKRIDFCEFLTEYKENYFMRLFIKKSLQLSDIIVCPIRVGNYTIDSVNVAESVNPENLSLGRYKFYSEIVEFTGESPKVFAMQVNTQV
ncbi:hypothetical protein KR222_010908, partial [Zaprionus bogoriensis]